MACGPDARWAYTLEGRSDDQNNVKVATVPNGDVGNDLTPDARRAVSTCGSFTIS